MRPIDGRTSLVGILGHPLDHTLSPSMHNAAYEAMGLNWVYVALDVRTERELAIVVEAVRALKFVGLNVTMPYKHALVELCDELSEMAAISGAVNTVQNVDGRLIGHSTDGRGLLESLSSDVGFDPSGTDVVVLGAGGAAASAVVALALGNAAAITIVNRDEGRAGQLAERVASRFPGTRFEVVALGAAAERAVSAADLVVNATPVGMRADDPSPIPASLLRSGQVVADMVYKAHPTSLIRSAEEAGAIALDGLGMLVCQGAIAIDIWNTDSYRRVRAPREVMRASAIEALRARG